MHITEQHIWNIILSIFFAALVVYAVVILETRTDGRLYEATVLDMAIITLATFRLIRLFVYDKITAFFREQFYVAERTNTGVRLEKPERGFKRAVLDLLLCPWCFGVWAAAAVIFFYFFSPIFFFPILLLALSGVATFIQLSANLVGWKAEQLKHDVERQTKA